MKNINERPSEKSVYIWNIVGNIGNALLSVIVLMIVIRLLDDKEADIFSIAWSISQLMVTIATFQIRMYQATDVTGVFCFEQYLIYRYITIGIMLVCSCAYIVIRGYTGEKALVVLLMCVFRAVDSLADVYEGWFQLKERLDLAGKALTFRIVAAVFGFGIGLAISHSLVWSSIVLIAVYIVCFFVYTFRYYQSVVAFREHKRYTNEEKTWVVKMTVEGFPLFINAFLMLSIMNAPKMELDTAIQQGMVMQGAQTIFNIIFMPASFLNLAYIVFRPLITKMAIMWNLDKIKNFLKILVTIGICLLFMAIGLLFGSYFLGIPVLSVLYAIDLSGYKKDLLIIIVGGCVYAFGAVLDNALVVMRRQYVLLLSYVVTYVYIRIVTGVFVERFGIMGGSLSYATAMVVFFVVTLLMFLICIGNVYIKKKIIRKKEEEDEF